MSDNASNQESKSDEPSAKFIKLKVIDQDQKEIHFRVRMTTKFSKVKQSYADRVGTQVTVLRFLFDGHRIGDEDTPEKLKMEDEDVVEVVQEQTGGGRVQQG